MTSSKLIRLWALPLFLVIPASASIDSRPGAPDPDWQAPAGQSATAIHARPGGGYWLLDSCADFRGTMTGLLLATGPDGTPDPSWHSTLQPEGLVLGMTVTPGGGVVVCGSFLKVDGIARPGLARLGPSGSLDPSFSPALSLTTNVPPPGGGPPLPPNPLPPYGYGIQRVAAQPDGGVLVWGWRRLTRLDGSPVPHLVRLRHDGAWDDGFQFPGDVEPLELRVLSDGKFVTVEDATVYHDGQARLLRQSLKRWLADGRPDPGFDPVLILGGAVYDLAEQGSALLVAGEFSRVNDVFRDHLARILPDGHLDATFHTPFVGPAYDQRLYAISALADGPVFVAGDFATGGPDGRRHLARLNADGSLDRSFRQPPIVSQAGAVHALSNGGCLVASLTTPHLMRLHGDRTDGMGAFTLSTDHVEISEDGGSVEVAVERFWGREGVVSVEVRVEGQDAVAGEDFDGTTQTLVFAHGESRKSVRIPIFDDDWIEDLEAFRVVIEAPKGGAELGALTRLTVSLMDNDGHSAVDPGFRFPESGIDGRITSLATQSDGRILVAGEYTRVGTTARAGLARLERDGRLDLSFNPMEERLPGESRSVRLVQYDKGSILISGDIGSGRWPESEGTAILSLGGQSLLSFERLGLAKDSFGTAQIEPYGTDGWIVAGVFNPGSEPWGLARFTAGGRLDRTFLPPGLGQRESSAVAVESDGSVLVGRPDPALYRIAPDGSVATPVTLPLPINGIVGLTSLEDRRFLAWGLFGSPPPGHWQPLLRCLPDGRLDPEFHPDLGLFMPGDQLATVQQVTQDPERRLLVALHAYPTNGFSFDYLLRLLPDGALDHSFEPVAFSFENSDNHTIHSIIVAPDGSILVGGEFTHMNGLRSAPLVRLKGIGPVGHRRPAVRNIARTNSGAAEVQISVAPARRYILERSSDLRQWQDVTTNRSAISRTVSRDPGTPGAENTVFYRIVQFDE